MNRFEAHPKKTLAVVLLLMFAVVITGSELFLSAYHEELGLERPGEDPHLRYLRLREWPPNSTAVYRAPEARKNDSRGPVDETYELSIDAHGFIKPSIIHEEPDLEIVFLGASTTECLYVRPENRFPHLAGRELEKATGLKINALNAGKSGNHTLHSIVAYFGKIAPRRPEYAVLMHATNDIGTLNSQSTYWNDKPGIEVVLDESRIKRRGPITQFVRRTRDRLVPYTYRVIRSGLDAAGDGISALVGTIRPEPEKAKPNAGDKAAEKGAADKEAREARRREVLRESFEPALRTFVRVARAWGTQPVLMTQVLVRPKFTAGPPREGEFLSPEALRRGDFDLSGFKTSHEFANAIVRHVALSEDAILIDLARARQWSGEDVYDGLHFTETGSRRVADIVARALMKRIAGNPEPRATGN